MYDRESIGPGMDPWGTLAWTGCFCEHFLSRIPWISLLKRKQETRPNIWTEIPWDISVERRTACQTMSKAFDISSDTAPNLLKAQSILSDTTVRRSAVAWEDLKPYWKSKKRLHFSRWSTILYLQVFQRLY